MSIALMTLAWKSSFTAGQKMVLLALCDNANDQGECYPSIPMLAEKCSIGRSSIFEHMSELEKCGAISKQLRTGRSTIYTINPSRFQTRPESAPVQKLDATRPDFGRTPVQISDYTRPESAPITINESSIEPKIREKTVSATPKPQRPNWQQILENLNVEPSHARDWLKVREKAKAELTETALKAMQREAEKAGIDLDTAVRICAEKAWRGFNSTWAWQDKPPDKPYETPYAKSMREKYEQITPLIAAKNPNTVRKINPNDFINGAEIYVERKLAITG
jgi:DNA-binding transcriptional regulator YhcF (GntR family)